MSNFYVLVRSILFIKCIVAGKLTKLVNLLLCRLNQFIAAELVVMMRIEEYQ